MVEYTYDEAVALLESNLATALDKQVRARGREKGSRENGFVLFSAVPYSWLMTVQGHVGLPSVCVCMLWGGCSWVTFCVTLSLSWRNDV